MTMANLTDLTARMMGMDEAGQLDASLQALILQALNQAVSLACLERCMPLHSESVTLDSQSMGRESTLSKQAWQILSVEKQDEAMPFTRLWKNNEVYYSVPGHQGETVTVIYSYLPGNLISSATPPLPEWFQPFLADYAAMRMLSQGDSDQQKRVDDHREHWYEGLALLEPVGGRESRFRHF